MHQKNKKQDRLKEARAELAKLLRQRSELDYKIGKLSGRMIPLQIEEAKQNVGKCFCTVTEEDRHLYFQILDTPKRYLDDDLHYVFQPTVYPCLCVTVMQDHALFDGESGIPLIFTDRIDLEKEMREGAYEISGKDFDRELHTCIERVRKKCRKAGENNGQEA